MLQKHSLPSCVRWMMSRNEWPLNLVSSEHASINICAQYFPSHPVTMCHGSLFSLILVYHVLPVLLVAALTNVCLMTSHNEC